MDEVATPQEPLSLSDLPAPYTEAMSEAIIAPMSKSADMACGVFRADGSFCEPSRTLISANRFTGRCECPTPEAYLPGRYLFAGIGRHHFGHFLLECVPRLWSLYEDFDYDGIVLVPKQGINFRAVFDRRFGDFIDLLTDGLPVFLAERPVQIETLVVPTQGIGHLQWSAGTEPFRRFVRSRIAEQVAPDGPDLLYVSRTQLKRPEQMVDQEARIEKLMAHAGYEIFHPQKHSIEVQCARYRAASHIVGADGSAFHLAPFAMQDGTTVGLIQRRDRPEIVAALTSQIEAFCDVDLVTIDATKKDEDPNPSGTRQSAIDLDVLEQKLEEAGLI